MLSILKTTLSNNLKTFWAASLPSITELSSQQTRNTFILKRKCQPGLVKKNKTMPKLKSRHFVYELVEDTNIRKKEPIKLILLAHVDGLGTPGDIISVPPNKAYETLILPKLAAYASPANIEKYNHLKNANSDESVIPFTIKRTLNLLSSLVLIVPMSLDTPWVIEKWHLRTSLRLAGFCVPEEAITMPEKEITGPDLNKQNKEFFITITIEKKYDVKVRCRLLHCTPEEARRPVLPEFFYRKFAEAIFPEDQPILDSLPKHRQFITDDELEMNF
ncbi:large ribosomal subunit protein bL9m [Prorops nasuta]|uniref:large ribosomal subunit protein bL9m n=1 Tax=Prorops nasuta TaxID=863751 RepID=UPI0034CE54A1